MDLDDWELLPKNIFKDHDEDYFLCQDLLHETESLPSSKVVQLPIAWENKKIPNDPVLDPDPKPVLLMDSIPSPRSSFEKTKEPEFADMKMNTPEKITTPLPQIDAVKQHSDSDDDDGSKRLNLWKIGLNGIGAICSFGVAAATVCVFFLGHNNVKSCNNKNQMLRFQIYSDDNKRMKDEVGNGTTKLNKTIFDMKDVPVLRAQISFGGYV